MTLQVSHDEQILHAERLLEEGRKHFVAGRGDKAMQKVAEAHQLIEPAKTDAARELLLDIYLARGACALLQGAPPSLAIYEYQRAAALFSNRTDEDGLLRAEVRIGLGIAHFQKYIRPGGSSQNLADAERELTQALSIYREHKKTVGCAMALSLRGQVKLLSDPDNALIDLYEAKELFGETTPHRQVMNHLLIARHWQPYRENDLVRIHRQVAFKLARKTSVKLLATVIGLWGLPVDLARRVSMVPEVHFP
ncbi:MAG: hypothetical protein ACREGJ_00715 [Candidatus Saccharimonadales bacterium]